MGGRHQPGVRRADDELLSAGSLLPDGDLLRGDERLDHSAIGIASADDGDVGSSDLLVCEAGDGESRSGGGDGGVCGWAVSPDRPVSARSDSGVDGVRVYAVDADVCRRVDGEEAWDEEGSVGDGGAGDELRSIRVDTSADGVSVQFGVWDVCGDEGSDGEGVERVVEGRRRAGDGDGVSGSLHHTCRS